MVSKDMLCFTTFEFIQSIANEEGDREEKDEA